MNDDISKILEELRGKDPDQVLDGVPDEVRNKTPEELMTLVKLYEAHAKALHQSDTGEIRDLSDSETQAFRYALVVREAAMKRLEEHRSISEVFSRRPSSVQRVYANISRGVVDNAGVVRLSVPEARDAALHRLDERSATAHLSGDEKDQLERHVRRNTDVARRILVTENDAYRNAFLKLTTRVDGAMYLDEEERDAMRAWDEYRAASSTSASGGYGIPVKLAA